MQKKVDLYRERHGLLGKVTKCFYNPKDISQVLRRKRFTQKALLHSLLWPSGLVVLGIALTLVLLRIARFGGSRSGSEDDFNIVTQRVIEHQELVLKQTNIA